MYLHEITIGDTIFTSPSWNDTASLQLYKVIQGTRRSSRLHAVQREYLSLRPAQGF